MKGIDPISRVGAIRRGTSTVVNDHTEKQQQGYDSDAIDYDEFSLRERVAENVKSAEQADDTFVANLNDSDMDQLSRSVLWEGE